MRLEITGRQRLPPAWLDSNSLLKLNVHFEQAALKSYQHTPLETKLAKLKIAAAKIEVEVARETRDNAYANYEEERKQEILHNA